ncbi:MAG TPA: RNA polymerase sigma factor [Leeuwenhoekiella sp.]|nr:RNA polymerase sigma factor [Leeuwenhoekiella sp.]
MNQKDFLTIVHPFQDKIYRLARRLLTSEEEAQDATQEVLLKLWSKKKQLKKYRSAEAFAMTMTKNYCYDTLKAKRSSNVKLVHTNYKDSSYDTVKETEVSDSVNWVYKLMKELPEQQQLILQLRDVEQYTNAEIADQLEINEGTVRTALSRARKTIREGLMEKHRYGIK